MTFDAPKAPDGFCACRTMTDRNEQTTHLVRWVGRGTPGLTLCGLTRFDTRDPHTRELLQVADLPGWSMGGGVFGEDVTQVACAGCFERAVSPLPEGE